MTEKEPLSEKSTCKFALNQIRSDQISCLCELLHSA